MTCIMFIRARQKELPPGKPDTEEKPRKYHIGYIAGVFDLFHIGHLNMFRRAKEQCDYLIAAVVSDDGVRNNKKRNPISLLKRIEMVRACRYGRGRGNSLSVWRYRGCLSEIPF